MPDPETVEFAESMLQVRDLTVGVLDSQPDADPQEQAFVLLHGLGVSSLYFKKLAYELARHGRVVALDLPGFGDAPDPERTVRMSGFAMVVEETIRQLGLADAVLIGHSMGTQLVVEVLARKPGIATAGMLIGPVVNAAERRSGLLLWRFVQSVVRETPASAFPSIVAYTKCGPRWFADTFKTMMSYQLEERIREVDKPLAIVAGTWDRLAPRVWLEELQQAAAGPTTLTIVPAASHQVMVTHPERVCELVLELAGRG